MKKINTILLAIIGMSALSCNKDLLIVENESQYNYTEYFTTPSSIQQATNATYVVLNNTGMWPREYYYNFDFLGFDVKQGPNLLGSYLQLANWAHNSTHTEVSLLWAALYRMIARANLVEDRGAVVLAAASDSATRAVLARNIAEAKFLRSYARYHIAMLWGDAPLRQGMASYQDEFPGRAPVATLWAAAESDLKDAIAILPVTYGDKDLGRATKGAAVALLGKVYLYQKKWSDAQSTLDLLTKAPYTYDLLPMAEWDFLFDDVAAHSANKETIFQVMNRTWNPNDYAAGNGWSHVFGGAESAGKVSMSIRAEEYDFLGWNNTALTTAAANTFKYSWPGMDTLYKDPRGKVTFYGDATSAGATHYAEKTATPIAFPFAAKGYQLRKYGLNFAFAGPVPFMTGVNGQVIRYADVLLMLAEAYIQQGNTGDVPLGLINRVRTRAGAPLYTALGDKNAAMAKIELERKLELTGEQSRYFDLIRWGKYVQTVNSERKAEGMQETILPRHVLLPIPSSEKDYNANLKNGVKDDWN
ncbi:RagB/SusD family nutrient uptake outer membrane protein [Chitinophaga sp. 22620]|uniref:RagB/SusD family nutrient uptake outer membrane protein n=1 Tax=Chitinophaga sp. 22620 TaxID=3453952 RepID=UPI003F8708C1